MLTGRCECGTVKFEVSKVRNAVTACHCSQCRRLSGHIWATTVAQLDDLRFLSDKTLKWYRSSSKAKRGFCGTCGANLFWQLDNNNEISIAAGSLDDTSGLTLSKHIFVKDKGQYYDIEEDAPQFEAF